MRRLAILLSALLLVAIPVRGDDTFLDVPIDPWSQTCGDDDDECCGDDDDDDDDCGDRPCARVIGAWTGASQPRVDLYISGFVNERINPADPDPFDMGSLILDFAQEVLDEVEDHYDDGPPEPHEIDDDDIIVEVQVTVPGHDDIDGVRLTYQVDVLRCIDE